LRIRHHARVPQDIHVRVVNKLEKRETATSIKLHEKEVPKAISEAININKEKGKDSISHVVRTGHLSMPSKSKKGRGKRRCFKCKELCHFIASCPHKDKDEGMRRCFGCNGKDHMITSCPLMKNQRRAFPTMTLTKNKNEQQASYQANRRFCSKCGEQGHLRKVCKKDKVPKQVNLSQSYSLRRPKSYTCTK
jgi:hypothetical protein